MSQDTINYGIDLGTTNSSIARLGKQGREVIRNNEGFEYTPSAVYIDKNQRMLVGRAAKERMTQDPLNIMFEFKLAMGTPQQCIFRDSGRTMSPIELSAEVLKRLKEDVHTQGGGDIDAAVITIPAAFDVPECSDTHKAAELAGLSCAPLLQEPVAAALEYGFDRTDARSLWMVFDIGGGTFDAAVMQVRDGLVEVVNHGGDKHLGGKLIDWAIVEQFLVPSLIESYDLPDFRRGNRRWGEAFALLKYHAEIAKIRVSEYETATVDVYNRLFRDATNKQVDFRYTLRREQVSELIEPIVLRCIHTCREVLKGKRLSPADIEKLLLVGGPTKTLHLRELLSDSTIGLGIPLEFSIDPLTVVARGAAVFAGSRRRPEAAKQVFVPGVYNIELVHKPMGADTQPTITGKVVPPAQRSLGGFMIEFCNAEAHPPWRSGKIPVKPNGIFETTLWAEGGGQHSFSIELLDPTGRRCPVAPESITYTVALMISGAPLTHDIGVVMANNEVDVFFAKGTPLPSRKIRKLHKQVTQVRRNVATDAIRIPIVEGSYRKADRNRRIGNLEVLSSDIKRDLPAGGDVEITVKIDESRVVHAEIYVPFLDQEFSHVCGSLRKPDPEIGELCEEAARVKARLGDLREQTMQTAEPKAAELLIEIEDEKTITEIDRLLAACGDPDAANTCEARLLTLNAKLDEIEDCLEPATVRLRARQLVPWAEEIVRQHASEEDRRRFAMLRKELEVCMGGPLEDLRRKTDQIETLAYRVWSTHPSFWIGCFQYLEERREQMPDQQGAQLWFSHGRKAIANEDLEAVKSACRQLVDLLPPKEQEKARARGYGATTVKAEGT